MLPCALALIRDIIGAQAVQVVTIAHLSGLALCVVKEPWLTVDPAANERLDW